MGGHRTLTFEQEIINLKEDSEEYKTVMRRHEEIKKAHEAQHLQRLYTHKLAVRIMELTGPTKGLNVSKLKGLKQDQLIEVGKAARTLYDVLLKSHLVTRDRISDKWSDF